MSVRGRLAAVVVSATLGGGLLAAGCGGDDSGSTTSADTTAPAEATTASSGGGSVKSADKIEIIDFKFAPETVTVEAGTEVTWTNADEAPHTATADDSSFDTGDLDQGDSARASFDEPGTFSYYCRFHPFMKATVEVQ